MWDNLEEAFKELEMSDIKPYEKIAYRYSLYRDALMKQKFTRREAMRLVEDFAKLTHELAFQDIGDKQNEDFPLQDSSEEDTEDS